MVTKVYQSTYFLMIEVIISGISMPYGSLGSGVQYIACVCRYDAPIGHSVKFNPPPNFPIFEEKAQIAPCRMPCVLTKLCLST